MSNKKDYKEISTYKVYYVDIKTIMNERDISQNLLSKIARLSINTVRAYYHSNIKRIDLDVLSRICTVLECEVNDILKTEL